MTCVNGGYRPAPRAEAGWSQWLARATRAVYCASAPGEASGRTMVVSVPVNWPNVYDRGTRAAGVAGVGPPGLGAVPVPFPLATRIVSPATRMADGYQSTGMRPSSAARPESASAESLDTSNTATAFASASAAKRRRPSADNASALGVLPSDGPAGGGSRSSPTVARRFVSTTLTRSVVADTTYSRAPSRLATIAEGWRATRIVSVTVRRPSDPAAYVHTVLAPHDDTYTAPSRVTVTPYG